MSVLERKRSKSSLQALYDAQKMRTDITKVLLKDFGYKPKVRTVESLAKQYRMSERDAQVYLGIADKYGIASILEEFPYWCISDMRESIINCMREMSHHITIANSIYPNSIYECDVRREHQDIAIAECEFLLQEFQYVLRVIPLDANKLMPLVKKVEKEIALLKAWRKSDNALRNKIVEREMAKYANTPFMPYPGYGYYYYNNANLNTIQQPIQNNMPMYMNVQMPVEMCTIVDKSKVPDVSMPEMLPDGTVKLSGEALAA